MKKNKVGRPKLADKELKNKSYIMLGISALLIMILLSGTLVSLNIFNYKKLKGEATIDKVYEVGEEFCLGTECFYTISDNGDTVTGLAKYNLLVGNEVEIDNFDNWKEIRNDFINTSTDGYGLQHENAEAFNFDSTVWIGTLSFALEESFCSYWSEKTDGNRCTLKNEYGEDYHAWVFDNNSNLYEPVQNYQNYLKNMGYDSVEATLMSYDQAVKLGCDEEEATCENAPDWVYSTTYWLGTVNDYNWVDFVATDTEFSCWFGSGYDEYGMLGVRPVVTVSKEDLNKQEDSEELLGSEKPSIPIPSEETTTVATTTTKEETTTKKNVVTTTTTEVNKVDETTTEKVVVNKIVEENKDKAKEDKENNIPVVPIAIGGTAAVAGIGYAIYLLKLK